MSIIRNQQSPYLSGFGNIKADLPAWAGIILIQGNLCRNRVIIKIKGLQSNFIIRTCQQIVR